ncbi:MULTISPECIES: 2-amino-3,7-dideoxy-D-threo-hept-6-ulosonate synthase [unclassified Streptomyces]|jgi:2-amino-4,5-dihydroxy-6-oxo-7-(phosphonooxy)heptanoate synthase|uniref:2-amino-3,7-dideoxy-D-threo-hept-6-ulosonate synthase n=1 Tax=unclassified Streptomyces TaxID=2593676 RepID=UPI00081B40B1|nr:MULTISPECIES: 2-amino-3,7-dideoxy-D-threo-hept-6-ulosonate synthase [unclassified Streptomyces]MYQ84986.1 fructose-bisphosphate aldolase [Streptomyces sp. SID4936]SCD96336.1 2-amino-4,5-dihydroxy-6-oxo-7-(phosphonooxy)heptanoate synthase [Streptomyces sp. DvalAA-43]
MRPSSGGTAVRLARLSRHRDERFLFVPMDHSVADGPIVPAARFNGLVRTAVEGGADAVVVHKGRAAGIEAGLLRNCSLVVHLSASTAHARDADAKVLVGDVEEAVRLGADAVSVQVNIGSETESRQLADLGSVADACRRWNVPLLAMVYPRGPRITDPHDPALLSHVVNVAADLGADLVKTTWAVPLERMADVVESCPIPVLAAGGPSNPGVDPVAYATGVMAAGCAGLAIGRTFFESSSPARVIRALSAVVHRAPAAAGHDTLPADPLDPARPVPVR